MLLSFSVKNFRSFREEQTLSLVASSRHLDHPDHLSPIPHDDNKVLPVAVVYGANGAGKSNLIKALAFLEELVIRGTEPKKPISRRPFLLDKHSASEPTELTIQFSNEDTAYIYGCRLSDRYVDAEWLSVLRDGREIGVFERQTTSQGRVTVEAGPVLADDTFGDHSKAHALTKVGVLPNQLFLHAVGKSLREEDQGPLLRNALTWFYDRLTIVPADAAFGALAELVAKDESFAKFAGEFLRNVSTGVDRLRVESSEIDETFLGRFGKEVPGMVDALPVGEIASFQRSDGVELIVEKTEGTKVRLRTIESEHLLEDGSRIALPFSEESDGTQRLTHLLPALHSLCREPGLYVIDEIDRSLHPLLAKGLVRSFLGECAGKGSQLIFTTHETAFLDQGLLRRDEIWFANKPLPRGATELYSLADYSVRKDLVVDKAYLQGRFDAIPPIEVELPDWVRAIQRELEPQGSGQQS
jgi:AAA15 family ATPase/GTPase